MDRPNLFIKIPATRAGLPAIAQCLAEGISINVTLIFSLQRYAEVIDAFIEGMERAHAAGHDLTRLASVASLFVSRVDTEIDKRLDAVGSVEAKRLRGTAAIVNARLAFQTYEKVFASQRWHRLAEAGARPQRPLWASTGVKNPSYDDTRYVVELVTSGVVNTMSEAGDPAYYRREQPVRKPLGERSRLQSRAAGGDEPDLVDLLRLHPPAPDVVIVRMSGTVDQRGAQLLAELAHKQLNRTPHLVIAPGDVSELTRTRGDPAG